VSFLFGVSHLVLETGDLAASRRFFAETLGFAVLGEEADSFELDAAGVRLRFERAPGPPLPVTLRLQAAQLEDAVPFLKAAGARTLEPPQAGQGHLEAVLETPEGHRLVLWRRLREDELPEPPPLPLTRPWHPEAEVLAQALLAAVPESFRDLARRGLCAEAEFLCPEPAEIGRLEAVRGYIRSTPRFQRDRLRPTLRLQGFDPDAFAEDFAC
jgi:catechol 2,3-dioxygenase-like lactoylglutathione lyase family enzyme